MRADDTVLAVNLKEPQLPEGILDGSPFLEENLEKLCRNACEVISGMISQGPVIQQVYKHIQTLEDKVSLTKDPQTPYGKRDGLS